MFEKAISNQTKKLLALLAKEKIFLETYLAGGTALALHIGHRLSFDLDFYSPKRFSERSLVLNLKKIASFSETQIDEQTVLGTFPSVKFSIFHYPYQLLGRTSKIYGVNLAGLKDIAAMKVGAVSGRGTKRDFVDLYFIAKGGFRVSEMLKLYNRKYGNLGEIGPHILRSLIYFDDAEKDEMPQMLVPCDWEKVKAYFLREVPRVFDQMLKKTK